MVASRLCWERNRGSCSRFTSREVRHRVSHRQSKRQCELGRHSCGSQDRRTRIRDCGPYPMGRTFVEIGPRWPEKPDYQTSGELLPLLLRIAHTRSPQQPFFQMRYGKAHRQPMVFSTEATAKAAPSIGASPPISPDLVAKWVLHWRETGFLI